MDEEQFIQEIKKGSLEAINHVFKLYYPELVKHAHVLMKDKHEAEDVVQESFANILSKPNLWNNIVDLRWYLGRTVHNLCMQKLRKRNSNREKFHEYSTWTEARHSATAPDVFINYDRLEKESKVRDLLSLLAPRGYQAIKLIYFDGLSYSEASAQMGITKNSLKTHVRIAMGVMRKMFKIVLLIVFFG